MTRRIALIAVAGTTVAVLAGAAAALGGGASTSASRSQQASGSKTIYYVAPLTADANWSRLNACLATRARKLGYKVTVVGPPTNQVNIPLNVQQIEQAIPLKPAAIITSALDPSYTPAIREAIKAHIPVFTVVVGGFSHETSFMGVGYPAMGIAGAKLLAKATHGRAKIGIIYLAGVVNQSESINAFKKYLAAHDPNMEVVASATTGGDLNTANEAARAMLLAHPDITAFYGPDGYSAIAGGDAAKAAGKRPGQITVLGADLLPQQATLIREGWVYGSLGIVTCDIGTRVVNLANAYLHGKKIKRAYHPAPFFYNKSDLPTK